MVFKESRMMPQQPDHVLTTGLEPEERIIFPKEEISRVLSKNIAEMDFSDKLNLAISKFSKANGVTINTIGQLLEYLPDDLNKNRNDKGRLDTKDLEELNETVGILNKEYFKGQDELFIGYVLQ